MNADSFKSRTVIEYVVILGLIFTFFGSQFSNVFSGSDSAQHEEEPLPLSQEKIESLVYPDSNLQCNDHHYTTHLFSSSPLIIYIPDFISPSESDHLVKISEDKWAPSTIFNNGIEASDTSIRKSDKAMIDRDSTVQCIEARALSFQGWPAHTFIERLWTQRYLVSGHYAHHYDWASASATARRSSTFMVYVQANCTGGGTNFPLLSRPADDRWCEFVDCSVPEEEGVTFLPKPGSAVFWENFDAEGKGWKEALHAGMPVHSGVKIGLNIWSWYQKGHQVEESARRGAEL